MEVLLEALRGETSQAELSRCHNLSEEQVAKWKQQFVENTVSAYRSFYHTLVSPQTSAFSVRVSDTFRFSTTKLGLTLLNFGLNKRWRFTKTTYCVKK